MSSNTETLKECLFRWYEEDSQRIDILRLLCSSGQNRGSLPSLRLIEYCVINYAKKMGVYYFIPSKQGMVPFNMYASYKTYAKSTPDGKDNFDPFRRGVHFLFHGLETTVGQLNFFRWAIEHNVVDYVMKHREEIEQDMSKTHQKRKKERKERPKKMVKKELNQSEPYCCVKYEAPSSVTYELFNSKKPWEYYE